MRRVHEDADAQAEARRAPAPQPQEGQAGERRLPPVPVEALVESLQRSAGNAAVSQLLTRAGAPAADPGDGDPLPPSLRATAERKLGSDLGRVRVHADASASSLSESLDAEAVTVGQDVFLGSRAGSLNSTKGRKALLHELVHTVQSADQAGGAGPLAAVSRPAAASEVEAVAIGATGFVGPAVRPTQTAAAGIAQRKVADEEEPKAEAMPDFLNPEPLTDEELKEGGAVQPPKAGELGANEAIAYEIRVLAPLRSAIAAIASTDWEVAMERLQAPGEAMLEYQLAYEQRDPGLSAEIRGIRGWMSLAASQIRGRYSNVSFTDDHIRLLVEESLSDLEKMSGRLR